MGILWWHQEDPAGHSCQMPRRLHRNRPSSIPTAQPDCWGRMEPVIPSLEEPKQLCNQKGSYLHSGALPEVSSIAPFEEKAGFGCRAEGRRRAPPGDKQPQENRTVAVTRKVPSDDVTGAPSAKAIVQPRSPPPHTPQHSFPHQIQIPLGERCHPSLGGETWLELRVAIKEASMPGSHGSHRPG